jgi:hypothetical protein
MAGSKSNTWENGMLLLLFNNTTFTGVGDAAGLLKSAADGNLYVSLHTADPGEAGDQTTSECAYTGYARVGVVRTAAGWTVAANAVSNAAAITFGLDTVGAEHVTHFGVGTLSAAAGKLLYSGELTAHLDVAPGITPSFAIGELDITES